MLVRRRDADVDGTCILLEIGNFGGVFFHSIRILCRIPTPKLPISRSRGGGVAMAAVFTHLHHLHNSILFFNLLSSYVISLCHHILRSYHLKDPFPAPVPERTTQSSQTPAFSDVCILNIWTSGNLVCTS
jgi:hypothetical protein